MAKDKIDEGVIMKALNFCYEKALSGVPGLPTSYELADDYMKKSENIHGNADSLINWQIAKCATSGFVTGLGGLLTLPVAIPANLSCTFYVQLRMVTALAVMGNYDPRQDQVKALVYTCLCGSAATEILKDIGVKVGMQVTKQMIQKISGTVITKINQAVGFRLVTKFGQTGLINLSKAVPIVGGIVGGTIDGIATQTIGTVSKSVFLGKI